MTASGLLTGLTSGHRMDEQRDLTWRHTRAFSNQVCDCRGGDLYFFRKSRASCSDAAVFCAVSNP